jgi:hypothetical protein
VSIVHEPAGSVECGYVKIRERSGSMWWEYVVVGRLLDWFPGLGVHAQTARCLLGTGELVECRVSVDLGLRRLRCGAGDLSGNRLVLKLLELSTKALGDLVGPSVLWTARRHCEVSSEWLVLLITGPYNTYANTPSWSCSARVLAVTS